MAASKTEGDRIAAELVTDTAAWFDVENAKPMVNECVQVSRKITARLMAADLNGEKIKDLTQMLAYVGKTLDQVARFIQFSQGKADTRTEITVASLLPLLTEEELAIFDKALARLEATGAEKPSEMH